MPDPKSHMKQNKDRSNPSSTDMRTPLFNPLRTKRAFEEISHEIKQLIFRGVLKPGDRLPSETELAGQFQVGRQTIREALRLLELSGFIGTQTGGAGGAIVVDTILTTISNSFLDLFQMKRITITQVTSARLQIEKLVISNVVRHADDQDIELLQANVRGAEIKTAEGSQAFEENIQFHKLLAKASKNQVFVVIMESIAATLSHIRSLLGMDLELSSQAVQEHREILDAIVRREEEKALQLLELHLSHIEQMHKNFAPRHEKRKVGKVI